MTQSSEMMFRKRDNVSVTRNLKNERVGRVPAATFPWNPINNRSISSQNLYYIVDKDVHL